MKIGDKVRFLSTTGGGVVAGFQGSNIALVEDEDGFQIPTMVSDLVVVNDDKQSRNVPNIIPTAPTDQTNKTIERVNASHNEEVLSKISDGGRYKTEERADADRINLYLGFVPKDKKQLTKTAFHLYIINDSNYFLSYTYSLFDGKSWTLLSHNELEPNTKLLVSEVKIESVADFRNGAVQLTAYKVGKPFDLQPTLDVRVKVDPVKFYKLHAFRENDFFDEDAFVIPVVNDGKPVKELAIDSNDLKEKMLEKQKIDVTAPARKKTAAKRDANEPLVIDLHASELLDTTAGMSHSDILNYQLDVFRKTVDEFMKNKGMKIIFIHGKGDGVLRSAIIHELKYRYKSLTYQDASFQEYGYGATQVTIH